METLELSVKSPKTVLALGPESAGNFTVFRKGRLYFSKNFGDLLEKDCFDEYVRELEFFLKKERIKPDVILCDSHPLFETTKLAHEMAGKYQAEIFQVQHHLAHIFSAVGEQAIIEPTNYNLKPKTFLGVACDGTGLGTDGEIWGGEIFRIQESGVRNQESGKCKITRIGHLENQLLLGGEMAIREPARMLISILGKFLPKEEVFLQIKKYYSQDEFELLWNQCRQNFNCLETSSTGRVLDAVSILLGFVGNKRGYKHEAIDLLEKNSTKPYADLKPKIGTSKSAIGHRSSVILNTTYLFEYLIKNINKDKRRLAATAQLYIAEGLCEIIQNLEPKTYIFRRRSRQQQDHFIISGIQGSLCK